MALSRSGAVCDHFLSARSPAAGPGCVVGPPFAPWTELCDLPYLRCPSGVSSMPAECSLWWVPVSHVTFSVSRLVGGRDGGGRGGTSAQPRASRQTTLRQAFDLSRDPGSGRAGELGGITTGSTQPERVPEKSHRLQRSGAGAPGSGLGGAGRSQAADFRRGTGCGFGGGGRSGEPVLLKMLGQVGAAWSS